MQLAFDIYNPFIIDSLKNGPVILITAGVHGDEYEPMVAAFELIEKLQGQVQMGKVIIVPVTNVSAYYACSRFGSDNQDLARICPGKEHGTESEKAAWLVSRLIVEADYYVDLHTGGKEFTIYPLAGYMLHLSPDILQKQQWMATSFGLPVVWGTDSALNGRTLSVARDAGVPAIYVEYGGGEPYAKEVTAAYVAGCLNILAGLKIVNQDFNVKQPTYWVEDYTPNKGHLQSKMPAITEGIFIPYVKPGDFVLEDASWGHIVNIADRIKVPVVAEEAGMVLFLRANSFVRKNNSLGGVLSITKPGKIKIG